MASFVPPPIDAVVDESGFRPPPIESLVSEQKFTPPPVGRTIPEPSKGKAQFKVNPAIVGDDMAEVLGRPAKKTTEQLGSTELANTPIIEASPTGGRILGFKSEDPEAVAEVKRIKESGTPLEQVSLGVRAGADEFLSGLTTPVSIGTFGAAGLLKGTPILARALSAWFAYHTGKTLAVDTAQALVAEYGKPEAERDTAKLAKLWTGAALATPLTFALGKHAIRGDKAPLISKTGPTREDHLRTLGLEPTATEADVKTAFRAKAKEFHPDVNPSPEAAAQFQAAMDAYTALTPPKPAQETRTETPRTEPPMPAAETVVPKTETPAPVTATTTPEVAPVPPVPATPTAADMEKRTADMRRRFGLPVEPPTPDTPKAAEPPARAEWMGKRPLVRMVGPDGRDYWFTFDGYQDLMGAELGGKERGLEMQVTPVTDSPGAMKAESTTYGYRLANEGYTLPADLPTYEQWQESRKPKEVSSNAEKVSPEKAGIEKAGAQEGDAKEEKVLTPVEQPVPVTPPAPAAPTNPVASGESVLSSDTFSRTRASKDEVGMLEFLQENGELKADIFRRAKPLIENRDIAFIDGPTTGGTAIVYSRGKELVGRTEVGRRFIDEESRKLVQHLLQQTPPKTQNAALPAPFEVSTPPQPGKDVVKAKGTWDIVDASEYRDVGKVGSLQERNRQSQQSKEQINEIANRLNTDLLGDSKTTLEGSPIIAENGERLAGYGRIAGIRTAYESDNEPSRRYRAWVQTEAARLGISDRLNGKNQPILVRRVTEFEGGSREDFARDSNADIRLQFTPTELAMADARAILENSLLNVLDVSEDGTLNRAFLDKLYGFMKAKDGLKTTDGAAYLPAMETRAKNAILTALLHEAPKAEWLIRQAVEKAGDRGIVKQVNGLVASAGKLLQLKGTPFDLSKPVAQALADLIEVKKQIDFGYIQGLDEWLSSQDLFGTDRTAESDMLLRKLVGSKSVKTVVEYFDEFSRVAQQLAKESQTSDMFGGQLPQAKPLDILTRLNERDKPVGEQGRLEARPPQPSDGKPGKPGSSGTQPSGEQVTGKPAESAVETYGESEIAFPALGPGHAKFSKGLQKLVDKGFMDEPRRQVLERMFRGSDDNTLGTINIATDAGLQRGGMAIAKGGKLTVKLKPKMLADALSDDPFWSGIDVDPLVVFLHEFGHIEAYFLSSADRAVVKEEFAKLGPEMRKRLFGEAGFSKRADKVEQRHSEEYFSKNEDEFLVQSFAEWTVSQFSEASEGKAGPKNPFRSETFSEKFKAVLAKLFARFMDGIRRVLGRTPRLNLDPLHPVFEKMLRGERGSASEPRNVRSGGQWGTVAPDAKTAGRAIETAALRGERGAIAEANLISGQHGFLARKLGEHTPEGVDEGTLRVALQKVGAHDVQGALSQAERFVPPEEFSQGMQRLEGDPLQATYAKEVGMRYKVLEKRLIGVMAEYARQFKFITSDRFQALMQKAQEKRDAAFTLEWGKKQFEARVVDAVANFKALLEKSAKNEGQAELLLRKLRGAESAAGYAEAVKSALRDIVTTLAKDPAMVDFLYSATPADVQAIVDNYNRLKVEGKPEETVVKWAAEILARSKDIAQQLVVRAALQADDAFRAEYDAYELAVFDMLRKNPRTAARMMVSKVASLSDRNARAQAAFAVLNKKVEGILRDFDVAETAASIARGFLEDEETRAYRRDVYKAGRIQDRPDDADEYDSLELREGITLPGGGKTEPLYLYGDAGRFNETLGVLNGSADTIAKWLATNPDHPHVDYWRRKLDYIQNVLASSRTMSPTKLKAPFKDFGPWGMTRFFADDLGTREAARLKVSLANHARADEMAKQLLHENFSRLTQVLVAAAQSHEFTEDLGNNRGSIHWYNEVGNALMSSWQNPEGGLEVGEMVNGHAVTKEDVAAMRFMSDVTAKGFDIVQSEAMKGREGVMQPLFFRTVIGETGIAMHVQSTKVTKNTVTRSYNPEALRFVEAYQRGDASERVRLLNANFWNIVVRHLADRSNSFLDGTSMYEGAYKQISTGIQQDGLPMAKRNMPWLVEQIMEIDPPLAEDIEKAGLESAEDYVLAQVMGEFDKMTRRLANEFAKDDTVTIDTVDTKSSFTKARQAKLAGDWLYNHGFKDSSGFVGFSMAISGYYYTRAAEDFGRVKADLERQRADLERKMRSLAKQRGLVDPEQARKEVVAGQSDAILKGKTYDDYENIDRKIKLADKYQNLFSQVFQKGQNVDYDFAAVQKVFGATTGSVLMSELTALRNIGFGWFYIGQAINKMQGTTMSGYAKAAWDTWGRTFPAYFASAALSVGKAGTIGIVKGVGQGVFALMNRQGRIAVSRFMQPIVEELTQATFERIALQRRLFELGYSSRTYAMEDVTAKLLVPSEGGAIREHPLFSSALGQMGFAGLSLYDAAILSSFGKPLFPRWADMNVNAAAVKAAFDVVQRIEDQLKSLHALYKEKGVERFDFANPQNPSNRLSPEEVFGRQFLGKRTQNDLTQLRQWFEWGRKGFDEYAMEFLAKLEAGDKEARMMSEADRFALADIFTEDVNKASATNRPLQFKLKGIWQFIAPLLGWNVQRFRTYVKYFSRAAVDPSTSKFVLWMAIGMGVVIPALLAGASADTLTEEMARALYWMFRGEKRATRQPWEREGTKSQAIGWAISSLNPIPFVQTLANAALEDMPKRASADPILFLQNKITDVTRYVGGVVQTGDMAYGLPQLVKSFLPFSTVVLNRLDSTEGSIEALNARRLMQRSGPQDMLKEQGVKGAGASKVTELTPYGERMLNAAMRGDMDEFSAVYAEGVAKARELGRPDPEKLMAQMFAARNPYDRAFKSKLTSEQHQAFLDKLEPGERAMVEAVEDKYAKAASLIGAPHNFERKASTVANRGASGVGTASANRGGTSAVRTRGLRLGRSGGRRIRAPRVRAVRSRGFKQGKRLRLGRA